MGLKEEKWTLLKEDEVISCDEEIDMESDKIRNISDNLKSPYEFFSLFIDENFINYLVQKTNEYANYKQNKISKIKKDHNKEQEQEKDQEKKVKKTRLDKWHEINYSEMEKFIAIIILMGIHKLPGYKDHFSKNQILGSPAHKFLSLWIYESISGFLHASDPGSKGKDKIIKLINDIMLKSQKYYYPGTCVTIDERMISFKGKSKFVVYEPSKPTKYGFRPYVLSDYKSGYTYALQLLEDLDEINDTSKIYNLVMNLMNTLNKNNFTGKKHILATDGLYTSEKLLEEPSFYFIGSLRYNRIKSHHEEITKPIKKEQFQYFYKKFREKYFLMTKYMDNKLVLIVSNFLSSSNTLNRFRWNRKENKFNKIKYPETIKIYSHLMKGVDIANQLISYYELRHRTYKWWKRILYHLFDISIVNSFIIYKKVTNDNNMLQKRYRIEILNAIAYKYGLIPENIGKNMNKKVDMHLVAKSNKRKICTYCSITKNYTTAKTPVTQYICMDCKIHICIKCFVDYHNWKFFGKNI